MGKTSIVLGGTGLVGSALIQQLILDENYQKIIVLTRRNLDFSHPKMEVILVDFDKISDYESQIQGDVLFSSMGTTIGKAKTKENQYRIDFTYQFEVAKLAAQNGVKNYVLISSAGANANSKIFYSKMKGELDEAVQQLPFEKITILRPSFLDGDRKESRLGEKIGMAIFKLIAWIPGIKKYRPIHVNQVAQAMRNAVSKGKSGIVELEAVHNL
jgi:uncharacterized protein YbjT (DUF2867 family)